MPMAFSDEITIARNSSKYGGYYNEATYKIRYINQSVLARYSEEDRGNVYYINYDSKFEINDFIDWFVFSTYQKDNIFNNESFDLGVGCGYYLLKDANISDKASYAKILRGNKIINSWRNRFIIKFDETNVRIVTFYRHEINEITNDLFLSITIDNNKTIGYKHGYTNSNGNINYRDNIYVNIRL